MSSHVIGIEISPFSDLHTLLHHKKYISLQLKKKDGNQISSNQNIFLSYKSKDLHVYLLHQQKHTKQEQYEPLSIYQQNEKQTATKVYGCIQSQSMQCVQSTPIDGFRNFLYRIYFLKVRRMVNYNRLLGFRHEKVST